MEHVTGVIYFPMYEELAAAQQLFPIITDLTSIYGYTTYITDINKLRFIVTSPDDQGVPKTQNTISRLRTRFQFSHVFVVGIAGSLNSDVGIGDIAISCDFYDLTSNQKIEAGETLYSAKGFNSSVNFTTFMNLAAGHPDVIPYFREWQGQAEENARQLVDENGVTSTIQPHRPIAKVGPIVVGPVVADRAWKKRIRDNFRKALVVETESSGVFHAFDGDRPPIIIAVRGVSDEADEKKGALEREAKNVARQIAAFNASSFLHFQLLKNPFVIAQLRSPTAAIVSSDFAPPDPISFAIAQAAEEIQSALVEFCPDYRATKNGYALPVPRVRELTNSDKRSYIEPIELISDSSRCFISMPLNYPDRGLPWMYALSLVGQIFHNKIVVPVVLDVSTIKPPRGSIYDLIPSELRDVFDDIFPVLIITNMPQQADRRFLFIIEQLNKARECVLIIGNDIGSRLSPDSSISTSWRTFSVGDVSFRSITSFVAAHFDVPHSEAEVLALRLHNTLKSFNLSAHPSYFAGIPREMLSRLAETNHRAELIELAVSGFLSFLGAGETNELLLKQRTRRAFLGELAYLISVDKKAFDFPSLIIFAKDFSDKRALGIESREFINSFIDYGVLRHWNGLVDFNVPFIQSYLLAERLLGDPAAAVRYFNPDAEDIDYSTFSLYCEIGGVRHLFDTTVGRLDNDVENFRRDIGDTVYGRFLAGEEDRTFKASGHALTSGALKPSLMNNYKKLAGHRQKIESSAERLLSASSESERKQEIIDLIQEVRDDTEAQRTKAKGAREVDEARFRILRDWYLALVMLGAAAEELLAEEKLRLMSLILRMSSLICDHWLTQVSEYDFDVIKKDISEKFLAKEAEGDSTDPVASQKFIELIVEMVEMNLMSQPFSFIENVMADTARNPVLIETIKQITASDSAEDLLKSLWSMEMRRDFGLTQINRSLTQLPKDAFLRVMIAEYLINRAFWYRGSGYDRNIYVDAVKSTIKPLSIKFSDDIYNEPALD